MWFYKICISIPDVLTAVFTSLHLPVSFPPLSCINSFFILWTLPSCQGAIICNLPKSSICWDTKHENEAIWCKMEAGGRVNTYVWAHGQERKKVQTLLLGGGGVGVMLGMWLKNKSKKKQIWICVRTYQSAHTMTSKWPSKAEMSSSQSHLSTLWHKEDRVSVSSGCCHAGPRFELRAHSWRPLPLHLRGKSIRKGGCELLTRHLTFTPREHKEGRPTSTQPLWKSSQNNMKIRTIKG